MVSRQGVLTAGTWTLDENKLIRKWPEEDTATHILAIDRHGGGSACNVALDLRRLDDRLPVETIGLIGDDEAGRYLLEQCDVSGIVRKQMTVLGGERTFSTDAFCVESTGRRTHFMYAGVARLLSPRHFSFEGTNARILHLGIPGIHETMDAPWEGDPSGWVTVLKSAKGSGLKTNLELVTIAPEGMAALITPCLPLLDYLVVNDFEIGSICGVATRQSEATDLPAVKLCMELALERGSMEAVVVHFPEGALALTRQGDLFGQGSLTVPPNCIKGANGAGDAFAAGFLYGQYEGWELQKSMALGHCAAGASMRVISTTAGVVSWRECLDLGERWGFRRSPLDLLQAA